jgi:hypothetical protein
VLQSPGEDYDRMYKATRGYYQACEHLPKENARVRTVYYRFEPTLNEPFRMEDDGHLLLIRGQESYVPGILHKTLRAFSYFADEPFDYVVRSNISSVLQWPLVVGLLRAKKPAYGGLVLSNLQWQAPDAGLSTREHFGTVYGGGTGIVYDRETFQWVISNLGKCRSDVVDDVALGIMIREHRPDINPVELGGSHWFSTSDKSEWQSRLLTTTLFRNRSKNREMDVDRIQNVCVELTDKLKWVSISSEKTKGLEPPSVAQSFSATNSQVVVAHWKEDLEWVNTLRKQGFEVLVYEKEQPEAQYNVQLNKGHEASVYLKYVVDHYDALPDYVVLLHGHDTSWHHHGSIVDLIQSRVGTVMESMVNLNHFRLGSIVTNAWYADIVRWFRKYLTPTLGVDPSAIGDWTSGHLGCAQFIVSSSAIRSRPLSFYSDLYTWLMTTELTNNVSGRYMEWTWHLIWPESIVSSLTSDH